MDQNEAAQRREVVVLHPFTDQRETYAGDKVYSINDKGIVIALHAHRIFFPWSRVVQFTYHHVDVNARKAIQGF